MAYSGKFVLETDRAAQEIELLNQGVTYHEIARATGQSPKRIAERNALVYRINIHERFAARLEREGWPSRLELQDGFGNYFAGLFDGEGHFALHQRNRRRGASIAHELALGIQVALRDDDLRVLEYVLANLGGTLNVNPNNNVATWRLGRLQTLAETVLPLFTRYPLRSKKAGEFELWGAVVRARYIATLGGHQRRGAAPIAADEVARVIARIRAARRYAWRSSRAA